MPSLDENRSTWETTYGWDDAGEEWSSAWGGSRMQWYGTILPRIADFLPAGTILEIAPGFGRWTKYLKDSCRKLFLVDLSQKCIDACRERFGDDGNIEYFRNDGMSLDMIPDGSIDFVFSYDSLVHADEAVLASYVAQLARKLGEDGAAFLHHSNLGEYPRYARLRTAPRLRSLLEGVGLVEKSAGWRDLGMSASRMSDLAGRNGLVCARQEVVNWHTRRLLTDCMSTIVRKGSRRASGAGRLENPAFMEEAARLKRLSRLYGEPVGPAKEGGAPRGTPR